MRQFSKMHEHNVGGRGSFGFMGSQPGFHNVGEYSASGQMVSAPGQCPTCPPGIDPAMWRDIFRRFGASGCAQLCNLSGGTPGLGFGGMCPSPRPPQIPVSADGCAQGWLQCKQPLAVRALAVAAAATVVITVTPRRVARAYQLYYVGAAASFEIAGIEVDGTQYLGSAVPVSADRWANAVTDHSIDVGEFSSTTPLLFSVTNITAGPLDFRAVFDVAASRS